ncbi:hypothetical protein A8A54_19390 [Brucella pseudogrignonensis]|nr:hypothetical protein A8A54_19390 [Brucella pseudogrignonensis]
MIALFPLRYAHWYAACLFEDAGHPLADILARLGIDEPVWRECQERYRMLHFANMSWVARAYRQTDLPSPEEDRALFAYLTDGDSIGLPIPQPFSMRRDLSTLRKKVETQPRIGPFADVDWIAHYICERRFPTMRYVHDGKHVLVGGQPLCDRKGAPIVNIDPLSFRQLGDRWFCDARRVYGQGETSGRPFWFVARGADPDSFVVLNERYGADKAAGYYITNLRLPIQEPGTFQIVSYYYGRGQKPGIHLEESHYAKDSRKVYAYGVEIKGADAPSFEAVGDEGHYFADKDRIYWQNKPIPTADRTSFTCASEVGQYCAYDRNGPYYAGELQSVTVEFERWSAYFSARPDLTGTWWHREKERREMASPVTGQPSPIGGPFYSDGSRIFVRPDRPQDGEWVSLDYFDHASFRHVVDVFGQDRHGLRYLQPGLEAYGSHSVKGADPERFYQVAGPWFVDGRRAYYFDAKAEMPQLSVIKADLGSFEVLGDAYARDDGGLIVEGVRKRGIADPASVEAIGRSYARMGETLLYRGKPVSRTGKVDPATARGIHDRLLIDAEGNMLFAGTFRKPIPGLDPASLRFVNRVFAVDDTHVYVLGDSGLFLGEEIDCAGVEPIGHYAVRVGQKRFHYAGRIEHTPIQGDGSANKEIPNSSWLR